MTDRINLEDCDRSSVVSFTSFQDVDEKDAPIFRTEVYKVDRLTQGMTQAVQNGCAGSNLHYNLEQQGLNIRIVQKIDGYWEDRGEQWLTDGVDCELLQPSSQAGWVKGKMKLKVTLEFHPADQPSTALDADQQPNSPLDEIRKMMTEND